MCTCDHGTVPEEYHTAPSEYESYISQESRWHTAADLGAQTHEEEECSPSCPSSLESSKSRRSFQRGVAPAAPLRRLAHRPDLINGVAIVRRRLDFDSTLETDDDDSEMTFLPPMGDFRHKIPTSPPTPPMSYMPTTSTPNPNETYRLRRSRPPQFAPQTRRQHLPRMTRVTPCGKCLRM